MAFVQSLSVCAADNGDVMENLSSVWETNSLRSARALDDVEEPFRSAAHAAEFLLQMGLMLGEVSPHLIAFTAGGTLLADELAARCGCPSVFAPVGEIHSPWIGGPTLGAVAWDGTLLIDGVIKAACGVSSEEFRKLLENAYDRTKAILDARLGEGAFPDLREQTAIVVDDGCAAPIVTRVAIAAARNAGARRVVVAVPGGQRHSIRSVANAADITYCANLHYEHRTHDRLGGRTAAHFGNLVLAAAEHHAEMR
jgi:predicted phosphoribosyltransferase